MLNTLRGHIAVGHCRYSTTGSSVWENAQPTFRSTDDGSLALGHNGNLINTRSWPRACARASWRHHRHRGAHRAAQHRRRAGSSGAALEILPARPRRLLPGLHGRADALRRARPAGHPPAGARPPEHGWVVASETAALDIVGATFVREVEPGELIAIDEDGRALQPVRRGPTQGLPVRVRLRGPARHLDRRPQRAGHPGRRRPPARPRAPGRGRPGHPDARVRHPGRDRLRRGVRHPVRPGLREELLRRPHVHPALPDHPPARHPAQAQPAARGDRGQAPDRRGRLDRARQHPAGHRPDAPRGRREGGPRPHLQPAGVLAVLLRHRLRHPRRADRRQPLRGGDPRLARRRHARLHLARRAGRRDPYPERPALPRLLRRRSTRSTSPRTPAASTCSKRHASEQHLLRGRRRGHRRR